MERYDILIIGGGAAGIAAAKEAAGQRVLLVDRREALGGVLLQCAHRGFGRGLTGPEYVRGLLTDFPPQAELALSTTVLAVTDRKQAVLSSASRGRYCVSFDKLILASGCREIPIGALPIAGSRPRGIYTAGQMQQMMNLHDFIPEGPAVILGSGDLGLIMARQLAQAGLEVTLIERAAQCGGMARNRHCLKSEKVSLRCGSTITQVVGQTRLEAVILSDGTRIPCATLLSAVGLVPDQILCHHLGRPDWLRLCGNCAGIHAMVESVTAQGREAGRWAAETQIGIDFFPNCGNT